MLSQIGEFGKADGWHVPRCKALYSQEVKVVKNPD